MVEQDNSPFFRVILRKQDNKIDKGKKTPKCYYKPVYPKNITKREKNKTKIKNLRKLLPKITLLREGNKFKNLIFAKNFHQCKKGGDLHIK